MTCAAVSRPCTRPIDEATAILAGDALLTLAFDLILARRGRRAVCASASGWNLIRRFGARRRARRHGGRADAGSGSRDRAPDETGIIRLQAMKTGALIQLCLRSGRNYFRRIQLRARAPGRVWRAIGLAFQLADDLLDRSAPPRSNGQGDWQGRRRRQGHTCGLAWRELGAPTSLTGLVEHAEELLEPYGDKAGILKASQRALSPNASARLSIFLSQATPSWSRSNPYTSGPTTLIGPST
jgi:farnesyl diphosphate synthase